MSQEKLLGHVSYGTSVYTLGYPGVLNLMFWVYSVRCPGTRVSARVSTRLLGEVPGYKRNTPRINKVLYKTHPCSDAHLQPRESWEWLTRRPLPLLERPVHSANYSLVVQDLVQMSFFDLQHEERRGEEKNQCAHKTGQSCRNKRRNAQSVSHAWCSIHKAIREYIGEVSEVRSEHGPSVECCTRKRAISFTCTNLRMCIRQVSDASA